ncbi:MAG TPA: MerR family transcriptional regulator [Longimicrobiaceae bacterium]|nr:MerR family transcriptional regulator [Longimicrobiaceae bacterium]
MARDGWKVGELARETGLTVRTLHHYDEIGLLRPSRRTPKGHRLYGEADVARLQQVTSLRQLGFALEEIGELLDRRGISAREVVRMHLERIREQMDRQRTLYQRLERIAKHLEAAETVSATELIQTIEATTMYEKYYTPEQREELNARAATVGEERIRQSQVDWQVLMDEVRTEMERGTDPADPRVQSLAARWKALIEEFTGGNPEIAKSVGRMWQEETNIHGIDTAGMRELMAYVQRAWAAAS